MNLLISVASEKTEIYEPYAVAFIVLIPTASILSYRIFTAAESSFSNIAIKY